MCVSAIVEEDTRKLELLLRVSSLKRAPQPGFTPDQEALGGRLTPDALAPVIRMGACGRLSLETMRFKNYVIHRQHLTGDMLADSMFRRSHGIIVLHLFSEWVHAQRLAMSRLVPEHEVHCAFNRFAPGEGPMPYEPSSRLVLANLKPRFDPYLVVPVLYLPSENAQEPATFVMVLSDAPPGLAALGAKFAPTALSRSGALAWLDTSQARVDGSDDSSEQPDFFEVLEDTNDGDLTLSLYKSA